MKKPAAVAKPKEAAKKEESSSDDSDSDEEEEEKPKKVEAKPAAKKEESSSDDDSSDDEVSLNKAFLNFIFQKGKISLDRRNFKLSSFLGSVYSEHEQIVIFLFIYFAG